MNPAVVSALVPVVLLVALGYAAGRLRWIRAEASKDLSNLVFVVLTPALMFRTMSSVRVQQLDFRPLAAYFAAALPIGADVFLFSQRYAVAEELVTACVIVSNVMALLTLPLVMAAAGRL